MNNIISHRGLSNPDFINKLKDSKFLLEVKKNKNLVIGVRDEYINIYHNCDSLAKIEFKNGEFKTTVGGYYVDKKGTQPISEDEWAENLDRLISNSELRNTNEKKAQSQLFINNNKNRDALYFCIDLEYTKTSENWRFDIIAIEKAAPHNVALIELKYGSKAIGGKSGIRKHIIDYYAFHKEGKYSELKKELIDIIGSLSAVGIDIPNEIINLKVEDLALAPTYYFITLDNNRETKRHSTPQMSMSGYLFKDKLWGCKRVSDSVTNDGHCYSLINKDESFNPTFLFSKVTLDNIDVINNIVNSNAYEYKCTLWEPNVNLAE